MIYVVILTDPDTKGSTNNPQATEIQQLKGIHKRILPHIKANYSFQEVPMHTEQSTNLKNFIASTNNERIICITSGENGLDALIFMTNQLENKISRKNWLFIWAGTEYIPKLDSSCCKIDLAIFPYWHKQNLEPLFKSKSVSYQVIFEDMGIYSDMRRDYTCFIPNDDYLPTSLEENAHIVGFILGGHYKGNQLSLDLIGHWLDTIQTSTPHKNIYFIFMDSPITLELENKGDLVRNFVIDKLKEKNIPYSFISCEDIIENAEYANDPLKKRPMILNWIESRSGDIYISGDNLGDIFNVLGCTQSMQAPCVNVLLPKEPTKEPILTDPNFFNFYMDLYTINWSASKYEKNPWISITNNTLNDNSNDRLFNSIDGHLGASYISDEIPKASLMARICNSLSSISLFKKKQPYTSLEMNETHHGQKTNEEIINPIGTFVIEEDESNLTKG
ncbi:MAG: hypothetical protein VX835_03680 [Pseudomonadota bacterium]|nr:hypothetical protein [Pseudomonadota bacterium]